MIKKPFFVIVLLATFLFGAWIARLYYKPAPNVTNSDTTVLLNRVRDVCKLVTVEGDLNVMYDEENIRQITVFLPLPTNFHFSKKANIEVTGKVLVGYDLEKLTFQIDSTSKLIVVKDFPDPEILSIEHDIKYRNLEESFFNEFSANDLSVLNKKAKEVLRQKAIEENLLQRAEDQGLEMLNVIEFMIKSAGWNVEFKKRLFEEKKKLDSGQTTTTEFQ